MASARTLVVSAVLHGVGIGLAWQAIGGLPRPRARVETTGFFLEQRLLVPAVSAPLPAAAVFPESSEAPPLPEVEVAAVFDDFDGALPREPVEHERKPLRGEASLESWRRPVAPPPAAVVVTEVTAAAAAPVAEAAARVLTVRAGTNRVPEYPLAARRRGCFGTVLLSVEVDADGAVVAVRVQQSCGHRVLDDAAVAAVRVWSFDGGPGRIEVPIEFVLRAP